MCEPAALQRSSTAELVVYSFAQPLCTGCGDCARVCRERALVVAREPTQAGTPPGRSELSSLPVTPCASCGTAAAGLTDGVCVVCRLASNRG